LTLFPFQLGPALRPPGSPSPFFLGPSTKKISPLDMSLNILLFVPFGFALANRFRERGKSWGATVSGVVMSGAIYSYVVEFLQIYVPMRDSGWLDVFTNATGALVGCLFFALWGEITLRHFSHYEKRVEEWASLPRVTIFFLCYFALWLAISVPLQRETRLSNWDPGARLLVGGDPDGQHLWKGQIFRLQIWDRALSGQQARKLTANNPRTGTDGESLASYDFSSSSLQDSDGFLPALVPVPAASASPGPKGLILDGTMRLSTVVPVPNLTRRLQQTNQFSVLVVCAPDQSNGIDGHLVSLTTGKGDPNVRLRQEYEDLVFWLLDPISTKGAFAWLVPNVFASNQMRAILVTYDGSNASLYVNGNIDSHSYHLGAGAALARTIYGDKTSELNLDGYLVAYACLIFVPAGMLMGIGIRRVSRKKIADWILVALNFLLPPVLLEMVLAGASGRAFSFAQAGLSLSLMLIVCALINADQTIPHSH
jgi:hypothetical protein